MRHVLLMSAVCIVLAGCQSSDPPATVAVVAASPIVKKQLPADKPETSEATKIALVVRKGHPITVGYPNPAKALDEFRDPKHSGSEYDDLPPNFDSHFKARTYETAHMGFGEILYDGELVAAMYQEDRADQDRVDELRAAHDEQVGVGATPFIGKKVSYWFWKSEGQRLMLCAYQTGKEGIRITVAMGDDKVMDDLGISMEQAEKDKAIIDAMPTTKAATSSSAPAVPHI